MTAKLAYTNGVFAIRPVGGQANSARMCGFLPNAMAPGIWTSKSPYAAAAYCVSEKAELAPVAERHVAGLIAEYAASKEWGSEFQLLQLGFPESQLLPYQHVGILEGVKRIKNHNAVLIGDEMGLGKTVQAILIAKKLEAKRVVVICPASLKSNWEKEIIHWYPSASCKVLNGSKDALSDALFHVVNYDVAHNYAEAIKSGGFDLCILDEAHYLKTVSSRRTKAVLGYGHKKGIAQTMPTVALSGTFSPNRPIELYPILKRLAPLAIDGMNMIEFGMIFCGGYKDSFGVWQLRGASRPLELSMRLRSTVMIRRTKKEVLTQLPEKVKRVVRFDVGSHVESMVKRQIELLGDTPKDIDLANLLSGKSDILAELAKLRHDIAVEFAPTAAEFIEELLNSGTDKVVVFAHHKGAIDVLEGALKAFNPVCITGDTPVKNRQGIVDKFQTDSRVRVFLGNIQAAGTGLTLTAAHTVVFAEPSWVPGENEQAVDRCHRIGQKLPVFAYFLVPANSLPEYIIDKSIQKQSNLNKIFN